MTQRRAVQVRLSGAEFDSLENWRRAQEKPRSQAIREAIRRLVRPADDLPVVPAPEPTSQDRERRYERQARFNRY